MKRFTWDHGLEVGEQLGNLGSDIRSIGYLSVSYPEGGAGEPAPWSAVEVWIRSRAVTVADIHGELGSPALEFALCSDLVFVRPQSVMVLSTDGLPPADGVIWALGRAGRAALARGLLEGHTLPARDAVTVGLANAIVERGEALPLPDLTSAGALTAARDLMRASARGSAGLALELATFRLLFAAGDPEEGARAFLEKRDPRF
jgi:enoyl-CoA hydratase/carnithine racemase